MNILNVSKRSTLNELGKDDPISYISDSEESTCLETQSSITNSRNESIIFQNDIQPSCNSQNGKTNDFTNPVIDTFLASIRESLKTFPPLYLHRAKSKIFSIVSDIEMEVLLYGERGNVEVDPLQIVKSEKMWY